MRLLLPGRCVLLMGASGSGKSTLANALAAGSGAVVVSYDRHQRRVPGDTGVEPVGDRALATARAELAACCAAGTPVIVDGTHSQAERRIAARAVAVAHGLDTVVLVLLVPLEACLDRQGSRTRRVPAVDVARQHAAVTAALPGLADEGHAAVVLLTPGALDHVLAAGANDPAPV
ncbi:AAA family ATPase [Actinosynnema sp. NPDC023587]|uniref:AAA family ATPase n=1 Tax=Actinosynnema sp. NPDC023587 TaxID=3154695 RepID=UPI0033F7FE12